MAQSDALGPAGTIQSNIEDMSHWMIAQLNEGRYKGRQVIPPAVIRETLIPNVVSDPEGRWAELSHSLYALGRQVLTYKGYKITSHTGSIDGYYSNLTFLPSEKLGIFIVYNTQPASILRGVLAYPIIDRLLGLSRTTWAERYKKIHLADRSRTIQLRDSLKATMVKNTLPSHPLEDYTGTFQNPIYGTMRIELQQNRLVLSFRRQQSPLTHFHYDQFHTDEVANGKPDFHLRFITAMNGKIESLTVRPYGDDAAEFLRLKD